MGSWIELWVASSTLMDAIVEVKCETRLYKAQLM